MKRIEMKRIWTLLLTLAFGLVLAAPAGAGKPDCSDPNSNHPTCQDEEPAEELPMGGSMCDPAEYPKNPDGTFQIEGVQKDDFSFTLSGKSDGACINVMTTQAGVWKVTIEGEGARSLGIIPRDSIAPGDSCGGPLLRSTIYDHGPDDPETPDVDESNPLILGYLGTMPATTVNACDYLNDRDFAFAEWVTLDPEFDPADCLAGTEVDGQCLVEAQLPDVAHPFALQVFMSGQDGKTTTFHVDLP